ncbi:hypothetical protein M569_05280 [Genlisea aurea]|uniref:Cyclin N-terminal domain-containing protein n=1 Tax=Genlisea aurea TaxID=192259 RepID=S8EAE7_9LAMI|nr:hypothetical protein M569_05280 [Genlisea aurea]
MASSLPTPWIIDEDEEDAAYCLSVADFFVSDVDRLAQDKLIACSDLAGDWTDSMRKYESNIRPCSGYLSFHRLIDVTFRTACVDYMAWASEIFDAENETLHLAVSCLDMYLSNTGGLDARRIFLASVTCLWVAMKHNEEVVELPSLESIGRVAAYWTRLRREEVLDMERDVLRAVRYQVWSPTRQAFLSRFLAAAGVGMAKEVFKAVENMAEYICEASLGCYEMLAFAPSKVAATAILLAKFIVVKWRVSWTATLETFTNYSSFQLKDCATALHRFLFQGEGVAQATVWRYSTEETDFAAKRLFPATLPADIFRIW